MRPENLLQDQDVSVPRSPLGLRELRTTIPQNDNRQNLRASQEQGVWLAEPGMLADVLVDVVHSVLDSRYLLCVLIRDLHPEVLLEGHD